MSTFHGHVAEFPDIRIDYFRSSGAGSRPPLALFLSHVHSDHLVGLESCKSPFIYCSPGTRDILLRLEKYPHRMNFAKGILETRKQTYRHLKNLVKAIPLETPTTIELCPASRIRVTLLDANHCIGGVMFLIEGNGKAILYTGDIRSEVWWVNSLTRNPILLPYLPFDNDNPGRTLDCIYLDTTFVVTGKEELYEEFPSKADGLKELLWKVAQYSTDTLFYLDAWTFGYEDVLIALSAFLESRIHVDDYRFGLYWSLANGTDPKAPESTKLMGFYCGNHFQEGCLTRSDSRIHSCEKGAGCDIWNKDFVRITPVVSRYNGSDIVEVGAGGGQGDLAQQHELEVGDAALVGQLMALCSSKLQGQTQLLSGVLQMLTSAIDDRVQSIKLGDFNLKPNGLVQTQQDDMDDLDELPLERLIPALAKLVMNSKQKSLPSTNFSQPRQSIESSKRPDGLPARIVSLPYHLIEYMKLTIAKTFPYSRHSSYKELFLLVKAFKPKDIYPCTVDERTWTPERSMRSLFGHVYRRPPSFRHDQEMLRRKASEDQAGANCRFQDSPESTSTRFATRNSHAPAMNNKGAENIAPASFKPPSKNNDIPEGHGETKRLQSVKNKRNRQRQGDHWPAKGVDHYSPEKRGGQSLESPRLDSVDGDDFSRWPMLTLAPVAPVDQLAKGWRKRLHENASPGQHRAKREASIATDDYSQPESYCRLSRPPDTRETKAADADNYFGYRISNQIELAGRTPLQTKEDGVTTSPLLSSPNDARLAFRQEVYDAILSKTWPGTGLLSLGGHHQVKEEEL